MISGELHELIGNREWNEALQLIGKDPAATKELKNKDFPLHVACENQAPNEVILEIIRNNTAAVKQTGRIGSLPLHLAIQNNLSAAVIDRMIRIYPGALDCKNASECTPRDCTHPDASVTQLLSRPTFCWIQMLEDETREEAQDKRIGGMQNNIADALEKLSKSSNHLEEMMTRMDNVEKKLREIEGLKTLDLGVTVENLRTSVHQTMNNIETRLSIVEEDVHGAAAREYISRSASRICSSDVVKMQKLTAEEAAILKTEVHRFKDSLNIETARIAA